MAVTINSALTLTSGLALPNRLVKAAMTEGLADPQNTATARHATLYKRWANGGIGLQLTGNVQINRRNLERPGNVVIEGAQSNEQRAALAAYAEAAKSGGGKVVMQLSHAGRQTPKAVNETPMAPSAVQVDMPGAMFGMPREMTGDDILGVVQGFGHAAKVARETGFDGVQLHAAHGYLLSQFLSPLTNQRVDEWGGSLHNRAKLLLESIRSVKAQCGNDFSVSVKLNSTDFQKGGFSHEDCLAVIEMLNGEGLDFVEVSGGNYEQPQMAGIDGMEPKFEEGERASTRAREAYFASYAKSVQDKATMPLLVTGGFRSVAAMNSALEDGEADLIGLGRPLCADPDLPQKLLSGALAEAPRWEKTLRLGPTRFLTVNSPIKMLKGIAGWGQQGWFCSQLLRMGDGLEPDLKLGLMKAISTYQGNEKQAAEAYHAALDRVPESV
ncbi:MAG: NADH:flavin oxidoreductase/NADH oxidase family protein [Pseudomonadota bacterium]